MDFSCLLLETGAVGCEWWKLQGETRLRRDKASEEAVELIFYLATLQMEPVYVPCLDEAAFKAGVGTSVYKTYLL